MPELVLKDDLLVPEEKKSLEYSGIHPSRLLKEIPDMIKNILRVEGANVFEDQIKWDASSEPIGFYGVWRCFLSKDMMSKIWIKITIQGEQTSKDKTGKVKVVFTGHLETKFSFSTSLHRSWFWLYNYFFYANQRRLYIDEGKIYIERLEDEMRSLFNLMRKQA